MIQLEGEYASSGRSVMQLLTLTLSPPSPELAAHIISAGVHGSDTEEASLHTFSLWSLQNSLRLAHPDRNLLRCHRCSVQRDIQRQE
jgi:hypothetical protein